MQFNFGINKGFTRRQFMKTLPLGLVSAIAAGIVTRRMFGSSDKENYTKIRNFIGYSVNSKEGVCMFLKFILDPADYFIPEYSGHKI